MPTVDDQVTVRALVNMPGVDEGNVLVVQWGPRLATLVHQRRYELVQDSPVALTQPADPVEHEAASVEVDAPVDPAPDGSPIDAPPATRRGRSR